MNTKINPPKQVVDIKRAKRFVDSVEEGDNLIPPVKQKSKDESINVIKKP